MKKIVLLFAMTLVLAVMPVFAQADDAQSDALIDDRTTQRVKDSGRQVLKDMKSAFEKASDAIDKQVKSVSAKACVGKWVFENGDCTTTIECLEDGSMDIEHARGHSATCWKGTYTSSSTTISFHVLVIETKTRFTKKTDTQDMNWMISYKVSSDSEMKLSSNDIPNDGNGYRFANATLFEKSSF